MNKKKVITLIGAVLALALVLAIVIVAIESQYKHIRLDEKTCTALFEMTPQEVHKNYDAYDCYLKTGDDGYSVYYTFARVDKDGYLVLTLDKEELQLWKNNIQTLQFLQIVVGDDVDLGVTIFGDEDTVFYSTYYKMAKEYTFELSNDYKKITTTAYDLLLGAAALSGAALYAQIFEEVPSDQATVEYVIVDENGNVSDVLTSTFNKMFYQE